MATWVLSECGLRPLPRLYSNPRTRITSSSFPNSVRLAPAKIFRPNSSVSRDRRWGLKVSAPVGVQFVEEDEERVKEITAGESEFNPGAPPPFTLADIRAAIPKHCWVKNPWKSMSYVVRDVVVVFGLAAVAAYFNNMVVWPLYWAAQGTMFWALFVLGHDCGHGSFSNNAKLNSVVGHLLHSSILVPYHGWRISHRTHHQNHGHVENDESWHPLSEKIYRSLDTATRMLRFTLPFPMLAYPFYLVNNHVKSGYQKYVNRFTSIIPSSQGDDEYVHNKSNQVAPLQQQLQGSLVHWERFFHVRSIKVMLVEDDDCTRQIVTALLRNLCFWSLR